MYTDLVQYFHFNDHHPRNKHPLQNHFCSSSPLTLDLSIAQVLTTDVTFFTKE